MNLKEFRHRYQYDPKTDLLGEGGFGRVYRAWDSLLSRRVALKIFSQSTPHQYNVINEIKRTIALNHPNICRYYGAEEIQETNSLGESQTFQVGIMECIEGGTIDQVFRGHPQFRKKLLTDVLQGLSYLHRYQPPIIHRDLKPSNVLVSFENGIPIARIADFGISKSSHTTGVKVSVVGTFAYMAPEQLNPSRFAVNGKIQCNLDLWSFGVMTVELLTGVSPFDFPEASGGQIMESIIRGIPAGDLDRFEEPYRSLLKRCLVQHAAQRAQTAAELIALLEGKISSPNKTKLDEFWTQPDPPARPVAQKPSPFIARWRLSRQARPLHRILSRRSRPLSRIFWTVVFFLGLGAAIYGWNHISILRSKPTLPDVLNRNDNSNRFRAIQTHADGIEALAFSPDGRTLATAGHNYNLEFSNVADGTSLHTIHTPGNSEEKSVAFSPDGQTLVSVSGESFDDHQTIQLMDVASGRLRLQLQTPAGSNQALFSPDGRSVVSAENDGMVRFWDPTSGTLLRTLRGHNSVVRAIAISPDGQTLAAAHSDDTIQIWDLAKGRPVRTLGDATKATNIPKLGRFFFGNFTTCLAFSPDNHTLASGNYAMGSAKSEGAKVKLWDINSGTLLRTLSDHKESVNTVTFSPDGRIVASGGEEGQIKLWNASSGQLMRTIQPKEDTVKSIAFSPDGHTLAAGSGGNDAQLWDVSDLQP